MNVDYSDEVKRSGEGYAVVQQVTARLKEVLGPSADLVKVAWDCRTDASGRLVYTLRLADWTGAVSATLTPDELRSPTHLQIRLYRLWGDLLQVRSHKLLEELGQPGA